MYMDMLRSEHIPFNLFAPLSLDTSSEVSNSIFQELLGLKKPIAVKRIEFEWPTTSGENHLGDRTAFDVYVECEGVGGRKVGVGIEVKYTEKSYPYGKTERIRLMDKNSKYHSYAKCSGLYREGAVSSLAERMLKQPWRNHLLGAAMVVENELDEFYSVLFYPSGNIYQGDVAKKYASLIKSEHASRFVPVTFERFIEIGQTVCADKPSHLKWLDYLEKRYIFK